MSLPRYPAYKDSGVEWLGDVPVGWEVVRFKRAVRLNTERAQSRSFPVGLENVESWTGRYLKTEGEFEGDGIEFYPGDLLYGKLRPYLAKTLLATCPGEAVGDFFVLRPEQSLDGRFGQYFLLCEPVVSVLDSSTFGSKMPRVGWEFLGNLKFPLPPLPEQRAIAAFLDRETAQIDALVAEQQRLIALLQEKRQAVISHAVTRGLNPDAPMRDSGIEWLGEVPAHWEVVRLKQVASISYGIGQPPEYRDEGVPLIRATNVHAGRILREGIAFVDPKDLPSQRVIYLMKGDIIVVRSGAYTGDSGIILGEFEGSIAGFDMVVRSKGAKAEFVQYALLSSYLQMGQIELLKARAAQPHLNATELGSCLLLIPPSGEQHKIVDYLESSSTKFDTLIAEAQRAIDLLRERRAALISAAVTGQIDVRAAAGAPAA